MAGADLSLLSGSAFVRDSSARLMDWLDLGRGRLRAWLKQLLEEGAVVNHGLTQLFRRGLTVGVMHNDAVARAIVLDHVGIADREVRGVLLEISHGIAAVDHHAANQPICRSHGC